VFKFFTDWFLSLPHWGQVIMSIFWTLSAGFMVMVAMNFIFAIYIYDLKAHGMM
jgi:hypothetical protein